MSTTNQLNNIDNNERVLKNVVLIFQHSIATYILHNDKGEFCSNHNEIYSSPPILFDTTESFTESCKQSLFTALSKRLSCVK